MKKLLMAPVALLALSVAACSTQTGPQQVSPTDSSCYNLTGAALVECQNTVAPAAREPAKEFKMVKPPKGAGGMRGGVH